MPSRSAVAGVAALAVAAGAGTIIIRRRRKQREDEEGALQEDLLEAPGMLLLEEAQKFKGLQPIAFLVHGAHKSSSAGDSEKFALIAEHLEMALLGCCDGADIDDESLGHIEKALGEGVERAQLLGTLKGVGGCAAFGNVCWRLKMAVSGIRTRTDEAESGVRRLVELIDGTNWQSDPTVATPTSPFKAPKPAAAAASAENAEGAETRRDARRQRISYEDRREARALAAQTAAEMEAQMALLQERNRCPPPIGPPPMGPPPMGPPPIGQAKAESSRANLSSPCPSPPLTE